MPGSLEYKEKDKHGVDRWVLVVSHGTLANGRPRRHKRAFHGTEAAARKALARFCV